MAIQGGATSGPKAKKAKPTSKPPVNPTVPETFSIPPDEFPNTGNSDASSAGGYDGPNGATTTSTIGPIDWQALLGQYGLPQDIIDELNRIFTTTGNVQTAILLGQTYIRGTDWYGQTYPGIQSGINAGLFSDEAGYKTYQHQISDLFQQYYGRDATQGEISTYATRGWSLTHVANAFQSDAILHNFSDPLRGLFTPDELQALSDEQAGIDSTLGQRISAQANLFAQVGTLYQNFYGRPVTRDDLNTLTQNGTSAQAVAQQFATQENINSFDPAIKDLFTPEEIRQMALDAAGGVTENGGSLQARANLAVQLNSLYHTYTGAGVSRAEVEAAYGGGLTADQVGKQLATAQFSGNIPSAVKAFFTADQLQQAADQYTGASQTAEGAKMLNVVQAAGAYQPVAAQYGDNLDFTTIQSMYDQGVSAGTYGKQLGGKAYVAANKGDIQQTSGAFGDGQLSDAQLKSLGEEQAGLDTPMGQQLTVAFQKALQRAHGAFQGALASPALSLAGGRLAGPQKPPDVAA